MRAASISAATLFAVLSLSSSVPLEVPLIHNVIDEHLTLPPGGSLTNLHEQDEYYVANIGFGTPAQYVNLTIYPDVFWTFILSKDFKQRQCFEDPGTRHLFDTSRSTTLRVRQSGDNYKVTILVDFNKGCYDFSGQYGWAQGDQVTDDITIGGVATPSTRFVVLRQLNGTMAPNLKSDGLLGLSRHAGNGDTDSTVRHLAASLGKAVVSFNLQRPVLTSAPKQTGLMTLGGLDSKRCDGQWTYLPTADSSTPVWNVKLSTLHVGLIPVPLTSGLALFDISTTYISFHTALLFVVAEAVGASFDFKEEQFYIDCSKVPTMSDLAFMLEAPSTQENPNGSFELRVPAKDYARSLVPRKDGKCTVLFRPISELLAPSYNARYIFGSSAAISHCWAYDFEKDSVAFSNALNA